MARHQKVMTSWTLFLLPKFDNSSTFLIIEIGICQSRVYYVIALLSPEADWSFSVTGDT